MRARHPIQQLRRRQKTCAHTCIGRLMRRLKFRLVTATVFALQANPLDSSCRNNDPVYGATNLS